MYRVLPREDNSRPLTKWSRNSSQTCLRSFHDTMLPLITLRYPSLTHSTTISEVSTMCTLMNEQLCSLLLWSLQSTSLCFSLPLSVVISNTDAEKDRGLLKKWLSTLGWPDRLVAGKIPYYTEYKTWDKTSKLENPPFISWWSWVELGPREWGTGSSCCSSVGLFGAILGSS